ncbi:predicted protein [Verticillium alfalfae VaMs.102]|uniref:Predicted protein n=1 Tax=Verticillium alfalfae (strain VaMs.102 / ATCC MYA-4576 / FGSC 10136) TaxID=526221 RepID=C9SG03_VERA1|nr:predicted protein [Verticillium alfalfae VaMs.102]EEY17407.1 predicted protein [Verticillium alfalfae VaMs.102]
MKQPMARRVRRSSLSTMPKQPTGNKQRVNRRRDSADIREAARKTRERQARAEDRSAVTSQAVARTMLRGRKVTPAGTWLQNPDNKDKSFLLERLPIELRYDIYDEVLSDMNPNISYVTVRYVQRRRCCAMTLGTMSKESKWRWGDDLIEAIPEMRQLVERHIGTHRQIAQRPLSTVRKNKDLAVYCFEPSHTAVDWRLVINKAASIRTLGPDVRNIGIRIDGNHAGGLKGQNYSSSHRLCGPGFKCDSICPSQLVDFIDNFSHVKHVYLLIMLQAHHMRVGKSKANVRSLIKYLVGPSKSDDRAKFEDRSRVWVEIKAEEGKAELTEETYSTFRVARQAMGLLSRNTGMHRSLPLSNRKEIKVRVLVTSFYLQ